MVYSIHFTLPSGIIKMLQIDNGNTVYIPLYRVGLKKMYQKDNGNTVYTTLYRVGLWFVSDRHG